MNQVPFKQDHYADFRLNVALRRVGQKVMLEILKYAIPKDENHSYHEHLSSMDNFSGKYFDTSQKNKLKTDSTGESFDITLIYKLFVHCCPKVFPQSHVKWKTVGEFDYYLGRIKKTRNDLVHSTNPIPFEELDARAYELKQLFINLLITGQKRFEIKESVIEELISDVECEIHFIISSPMSQTGVDEYLLTEGILESKLRYQKTSYINPVDFYVGLDFSTKIEDVFVTLEIKELENYQEGQRIGLNNLLKSFLHNNVSLIVVEGMAGSGKTTLSKYILSQWIKNTSIIQGLDKFSIVLYFQCNNNYINSIHDVIASVMPETSRRFPKEELLEAVLCQNLLIVIDGVDEAHPGTKAVIKELFFRSYGKNIKFFCTSRPEKVHWLYRMKGGLSCGVLSLVGIAKENRITFVKKLYSYYKKNIEFQKLCPLNKVIHILNKLSSTFIVCELKLPLFLALFTYLCSVEPTKMESLNSVVVLYKELITALKDRLMTRSIFRNDSASYLQDEEEIQEVIDECFSIFCEEAFDSLINNQETLSKESLSKIKMLSSTVGLNAKDILSSFLVVKIILTPMGIEEVVGFPHKGLKEYLAAVAAARKIRDGLLIQDLLQMPQDPKPREILERPLSCRPNKLDLNTNLMKYQNFILYLSGILSNEGLLTDTRVNEILKLYCKTGVYSTCQWLSLLIALDFHYLASEFILMKFKKLDINEDYFDTFINLLNYNCPKEIVLRVNSEFGQFYKLKKILNLLNGYNCNLKLLLQSYVKHPTRKLEADLINIVNCKNSRFVIQIWNDKN